MIVPATPARQATPPYLPPPTPTKDTSSQDSQHSEQLFSGPELTDYSQESTDISQTENTVQPITTPHKNQVTRFVWRIVTFCSTEIFLKMVFEIELSIFGH